VRTWRLLSATDPMSGNFIRLRRRRVMRLTNGFRAVNTCFGRQRPLRDTSGISRKGVRLLYSLLKPTLHPLLVQKSVLNPMPLELCVRS
jgi:hypothetical protein